ncbi:MAG: putative membrane protein [Saprospiraceae bacterium]|jgi:uncharacterized membrane protein
MATESRLRSILKAVSWRAIATSTTFLLAYFVFSSVECADVLEKSFTVAGLEVVIKLIIYYLHERAWQMAPRGSIRKMFSSR